MTYQYGNWFCKPANEAEAREIIERSVASGASNEVGLSGSGKNYYCYGVNRGVVFYGSEAEWVVGTEYSIEQVRELFPLPGEHTEQGWNGEGLPPIGVECEIEYNVNCWRPLIIIAEGKHTYFVRYTDLQDEDLLQKTGRLVFRPLRTERDQWVDAAHKIANDNSGSATFRAIGAVYDAIKSGDLKAPEVE